MAKRYYWIKLQDDFFSQREIKKLRKIAGGDTYTIIYLKMLLMSMQDGGRIYYEGVEDSFAEEIALVLDEDEENVQVTIAFLLKSGLMEEISETEVNLTRMDEMVGSETDKAALMRKKRAKEKLLKEGNNVTSMLPPVTNCYTEEEREEELEKESDIEEVSKDIPVTFSEETSPETRKTNVETVVSCWNEVSGKTGIAKIHAIKPETVRYKQLKKRIRDYGLETVLEAIGNIEYSSFLQGNNDRGWEIKFDWFIKPNNFVKVLEGNYTDKTSASEMGETEMLTRNNFTEAFRNEGLDERLHNPLYAFMAMRELKKNPLTVYSFRESVKTLQSLSGEVSEQVKIVNRSVEHGWMTFYSLNGHDQNEDEFEKKKKESIERARKAGE